MRNNPLKAAIRRGDTVLGAKVTMSGNPAMMALLKSVGVGFVEVDAGQGTLSSEEIGALALVGRALDLPLLVRVASPERDVITPFLDSGAWGVNVAGVTTAAQARSVVDAVRHAPFGRRGTFEPGPQNDFAPDPQDLQRLDAETYLGLVLESAEGLSNAAEIAAVAGVDVLEASDAIDAEGRRHAASSLAATGKVVSGRAADLEELRGLLQAGVRLICYGDEAAVLEHGFAASVARVRASVAGMRA